jgi:hypothetical protein
MNTIVENVLKSKAAEAEIAAAHPFNLVALFCVLGLVASLSLASLGFDVSGGIF